MATTMSAEEILGTARDSMNVRRVFGDPYERDGALIVPVARVRGGGGGGGGQMGSETPQTGWGGGFGVDARPVGVYVIRDGQVTWHPAVDATRLALQGMVVAIVALLVARGVVRALTR